MADEFHVSEGADRGRVNDVASAHELAGIEANKGINPALAREKELKRIFEGGLSDVEEKFVVIMNGMSEKYPDAYDRQIDSRGREFLRLRAETGGRSADYFTQYGLLHAEFKLGSTMLETDDVVDGAGFVSRLVDRAPKGAGRIVSQWNMVDLTDPETQNHIVEISTAVQQLEERAKAALKVKAIDAKSILENL